MTSKKQSAGEHEDLVGIFRRGLKFSEELLAENERLRFRVASLEASLHSTQVAASSTKNEAAIVGALQRQVDALDAERRLLASSVDEAEQRRAEFQRDYAEVESEHEHLANLYIASFQLHASSSFAELIQVICEIVINLIGGARFALYLHDDATATLQAIAGEGLDVDLTPAVKVGDGIIGRAASTRQRILRGPGASGPLAVVPLLADDTLVGVLVLEDLLVQKTELTKVDLELFHLLATHAATAILASLWRDRLGRSAPPIEVARARAALG